MLRPRWRRLVRDLWMQRGRASLMVVAVTVSLVGVGTMLGARAILTREIAASYLGTRPASATLELAQGVTATLVEQVRRQPGISEAEARDVIVARTQVGTDWRRLLLFVVDDGAWGTPALNRFYRQDGAWPPPTGSMLVERSAIPVLGVATGGQLLVKPPHGDARPVPIAGVVHDPGLAPAWQERSGYGYITRATLAALGEPAALTELRIELQGAPTDAHVIEARAAELAGWLGQQGHKVHAIRVPPPAQHPHQRQMVSLLFMMLAFTAMALLLSAILVATSLAAMLSRQVREIGVMKTVGARTSQVAVMYAVLVGALGLISVALALPASVLAARAFSRVIATMLNFDLASLAIPAWVFAVEFAAGVVVPLLVAALPIRRASRTTVRQALDDHGVSSDRVRAWFARFPAPLRNAFRRPARLALTLALLAAGGAMFTTALNVKAGWEANVAKVYQTRSYDVEVLLQTPQPLSVPESLRQLAEVTTVEAWGFTPAAFARPGHIDVLRTYPDRGHGSLLVMGAPAQTKLVQLPLKSGRWLVPGDRDAVVLNHAAVAQAPQLAVGSTVDLSLEGQPTRWRVVGIVEEIGSPAAAYVTDQAFAAVTGTEGQARLLRISTHARTPEARVEAIRTVEQTLAAAHVGVESATPLAELRTAMGDHIVILIRTLMAMAAILATVGTLGLASGMGISVVERTRELAIMKTLGATPARVVRMLLAEGLIVGLLSFGAALALSVPLTLLVDDLVGNLGFLAALPLILSPGAAAIWLGLLLVGALLATVLPARRAAGLSIREALVQS